ncbi:MAG: hypothetical protein U1E45_18610 [Geminicoccaceae bacterium]
MSRHLAGSVAFAALTLAAPQVRAQDLTAQLRSALESAARSGDQGGVFQALSVFGATPGISTALYDADSDTPGARQKLRTAKLPLSHDFSPLAFGVRPYAELTLGYAHVDDRRDFDTGVGTTRIDANFNDYSALAGLGATIPVLPDLLPEVRLRPILLAGYSRLEGDANVEGPFAAEIDEAARGLITDMHIDTLLLGGAIEAAATFRPTATIEIGAEVRYDHFYADNVAASDGALESSNDFGVLTSRLQVDGPLPLTLFGQGTRWIGFTGYTWLPDSKDALDFDQFFEVGAGLAVMNADVVRGVSGLSLRGSLILGQDVSGWSLGLSLEF